MSIYENNSENNEQRQRDAFNQWTRVHDDYCSYANNNRISRRSLKYYVSDVWAPAPTKQFGQFGQYSTFTPIGNQAQYHVRGNLTYPGIGEPTTLGNKRFLTYVQPYKTTPNLGLNSVDTENVDVESKHLNLRIGELTNPNHMTRHDTTSTDYNRWHFVDKNVVQNVNNIIFANGVIPVGGISTRNQLQNFSQLTNN